MGCCIRCCIPKATRDLMDGKTGVFGMPPTAAGTAHHGAGGRGNPRGPGMARFGPGAGLAASIMATVGNQLEAAAKQAKLNEIRQLYSGPQLESDGSLVLNYIEGLWSFSPAYYTFLDKALPSEDFWRIIGVINASLRQAQAVVGGTDSSATMSAMSRNLQAGNIAALSNPGNTQALVAGAQQASAGKEATMQQIKTMLFDVNRESTNVVWNLERIEYTKQSYTPGTNGRPGHSTTTVHVKFLIKITFKDGASALPPGTGSLIGSTQPTMPPDFVLPPNVTREELAEAGIHGAGGPPATSPTAAHGAGMPGGGGGGGGGLPPGTTHTTYNPVAGAPSPSQGGARQMTF